MKTSDEMRLKVTLERWLQWMEVEELLITLIFTLLLFNCNFFSPKQNVPKLGKKIGITRLWCRSVFLKAALKAALSFLSCS